jgi:hypothetical protein
MGKLNNPRILPEQDPPKYGGMEEDVVIYFLHHCMIERGMTHAETRRYFHDTLHLTDWTVNPYKNVRMDMVTVWKEGEEDFLHYFVDELPRLKEERCISNPYLDAEREEGTS